MLESASNSLSEGPKSADLAGVPTFAVQGSKQLEDPHVGEKSGQSQDVLSSLKAIQGTSTLMSLWSSQASLSVVTRTKKVWLGGGAVVYPS